MIELKGKGFKFCYRNHSFLSARLKMCLNPPLCVWPSCFCSEAKFTTEAQVECFHNLGFSNLRLNHMDLKMKAGTKWKQIKRVVLSDLSHFYPEMTVLLLCSGNAHLLCVCPQLFSIIAPLVDFSSFSFFKESYRFPSALPVMVSVSLRLFILPLNSSGVAILGRHSSWKIVTWEKFDYCWSAAHLKDMKAAPVLM